MARLVRKPLHVLKSLAAGPSSRRNRQNPRVDRVRAHAGRAGLFASVVMAGVGVGFGALAAYISNQGVGAEARYSGFETLEGRERQGSEEATRRVVLRPGRIGAAAERRAVVDEILERLPAPAQTIPGPDNQRGASPASRPQIAIIFDDLGLDPSALDRLHEFAGPLTFSFLSYGRDLQSAADRARNAGHGVMLHLPMEPLGENDPGPRALTRDGPIKVFRRNLAWHLDRFEGFTGVNNHMGSKLTADAIRMARVLEAVDDRGLYYLDSVTTADSAAEDAALWTGARLIRRDIFLDNDPDVTMIRAQLQKTEEIARRTGYAIAIAHPRETTLATLGPWLASARFRGFDLVTVDSLIAAGEGLNFAEPETIAGAKPDAAPALR